MDRNAKLRTTSGTMNIHQQSSPLSYHKYREIHYNIGEPIKIKLKEGVTPFYLSAPRQIAMPMLNKVKEEIQKWKG